jgi:leucyl aminopeptidase
MDVRHGVAAPAALADLDVEALALVVTGDSIDAGLAPALRTLLDEAVTAGDLVLAKGKSLYLFRPAGIKAGRVAVAVAADDSPKAFRAALATALAPLKTSGARTVAVGRADGRPFGDRHAEAAVLAVFEAAYLYRHSKPSAPAAWSPESVTILSSRADTKPAQAGIAGATPWPRASPSRGSWPIARPTS